MENHEQNTKKILRAQDIIPASESFSVPVNNSSVPHFDLATEIMAQQRKLTSAKRKKSDTKDQPENKKTQIQSPSDGISSSNISANESLIAEIVRKDIQRMLSKK